MARTGQPDRVVYESGGKLLEMGHERVTVQSLEVVRVDAERNLVLVRGSVPGPNEGLLLVRRSIKVRQRNALGGK